VIAHIRHTYTEYDALRDRRLGRDAARDQIRDQVRGILREWEQPVDAAPAGDARLAARSQRAS
jgi:hypothetical protein